MESSTKEVGLRLPVFLRTPDDMIRDEWRSNEAYTLCVIWSKMEFQLTSQICCHVPYPWNLLDNRTDDKFQS